MSEADKKYQNLMKLLRQLKREGAEFLHWLPEYQNDSEGDPNGYITITVTVKQKE